MTDQIEGKPCPNCGGKMQRQDRVNIQCLGECGESFAHYRSRGDDMLLDEDSEVVLRV